MSTHDPSPELRLTTTSYAILTQLALRPWSPYELVQQRVRYFRYTRPLTESAIYREMKRLAVMGVAEGRTEKTGRRSRTVYSITDLGLVQLREWLDTPVAPLALEFEAMIRLFAAPVATEEQISAALEQVLANARTMLEFGSQVRSEFLDGRNPLQEHVYVRAMVVDFRVRLFSLVAEWAEQSLADVRGWEGRSLQDRNRAALQRIEALDLPDPVGPRSADAAIPPRLEETGL